MMRDSAPPVVERPGLEDVAEEEDAFPGVESCKVAVDTVDSEVCGDALNLPLCQTICSL